jgi:hypothetical protein
MGELQQLTGVCSWHVLYDGMNAGCTPDLQEGCKSRRIDGWLPSAFRIPRNDLARAQDRRRPLNSGIVVPRCSDVTQTKGEACLAEAAASAEREYGLDPGYVP